MRRNIDIIDGVTFVSLNFKKTTGNKKLTANDLGIDLSLLPPEEVAKLGHVVTIDKDRLNPFTKLNARARRLADSYGLKLKGSLWAIPKSSLTVFTSKLKEIIVEYDDYTSTFLSDFEQNQEAWLSNIELKWRQVIKNNMLSKDQLEKKFSADFDVYEMNTRSDNELQQETLIKQANALSDGLFYDVVHRCDEIIEDWSGRNEISHRSLAKIENLRDKIHSLSFIDTRYIKVVDKITNLIGNLPVSGKITGNDLINLTGLVSTLSNKGLLKQLLESNDKAITVETKVINQPEPKESNPKTDDKVVVPVEDDDSEFMF